MSDIFTMIRNFHDRLSEDPHHRYRSWGHCYHYFRDRKALRRKGDLEASALQLGFYLASWGMYRGSTFLLWKDYRIHRPIVRRVLRPEHDSLLGLRPSSARQRLENIRRIISLANSIREDYCAKIKIVNGRTCSIGVTDTLITKILLATLACIPAYDEYVIKGLRAERIPYSKLNESNLTALFDWYAEHESEFKAVQRQLRENGLSYPPMKLVDMYLWERGRPPDKKDTRS